MQFLKSFERSLKKAILGNRVRLDYYADGLGVRNRSNTFVDDPVFAKSWGEVEEYNNPYWNGATPDIRWRAHLAIWAAQQALRLDGDFAEFGVNTGILSSMIFKVTNLKETDKKFYLFDTYSGIPIEQSSHAERRSAELLDSRLYVHDAYEVSKKAFEPYPGAILVKGVLPGSLNQVDLDRLCYVSIDLNVTKPEIGVIEAIWDKLVPGAYVVLDDYNFAEHREQHDAWNKFAASKNRSIFQSPTGQGLLQK